LVELYQILVFLILVSENIIFCLRMIIFLLNDDQNDHTVAFFNVIVQF
jgi:hypothetical protein